ncbi:hypothetical protein [Lysinibacillus pakistanensis]|uniref:Transglycosylase n=1 Tax=Lysinibacillus pakistanensis TaxID=759811 RepID=A0AAX3WU62_9BACI|nr:hypothetical protein [Lysinibacillus pakistanensis]MDM5229644.1 hypothetical protein [Lysinibacillus pakistanensis]WHY45261.1 hypothetical protein QNH22_18360 [Lysinibacillus pakistanensis]WHY50269.1 hypothetical protein QNH24_18325 [Lysinibacillus pakistanensis]
MANKPIEACCDKKCGKSFNITKLKTKKVKGGNEKIYFHCPHCKHEYIAYYASDETRKLQAEMRKLHNKFKNHTNNNIVFDDYAHDTFLQQEAELKLKIKQSMDEARMVAES